MKEKQFLNLPETTISQRLQKLRIERGLSQEKLSLEIGVERSTYGKYEQGTNNIPVLIVKALAEFYGVSTDYIILGIKPSSSDKITCFLEKFPEDEKDIVLDSMVKMFEVVFPIMQNSNRDS